MNRFSYAVAIAIAATVVTAGSARAATIGAPVTIGASADNSTIKMVFGSYSSDPTAAPLGGTYAVAYVTPASTWSTTGAVDVSFQIFNPGATYVDQTTDNERVKSGDPIFFNLQSTATVASEIYPASASQTTSSALSSVDVPTVGTFTTSQAFSSAGEYQGSYSATSGGGPGNFNYDAVATGEINAPLHSAGGGDIMNWRITPVGSGDKIYVSDFYKTAVSGVYAGFHIIGINSSSSWVGAEAADIRYVTPEPGTWAAIVGVVTIIGWQAASRYRRTAKDALPEQAG